MSDIYDVLNGVSVKELIEKVEKKIGDGSGWHLTGGISVVIVDQGIAQTYRYFQAVHRTPYIIPKEIADSMAEPT